MVFPTDVGDLIAPLSVEEFFATYWETQPLYIGNRDSGIYQDLIQISELDDFLSRADVRHPSVRLVKDGSEVPLERYTRELRLGGHQTHDLIDNDKMFAEYNSGATIVLQQLQQNIPGFGVFTNGLEKSFCCNVHASAFITPPKAQGFTAHYDTYSFIALQILGSKKWNIYDQTSSPPIRDDRAVEQPWSPVQPSRQLELRRGDLLYIPRGTFHDAETSDSPSIHMTIGFFTPNWIDVAKAAVTSASDQPTLRNSVPIGIRNFSVNQAVAKAIAELDLAEGLRKLQKYYATRRVDVRSGRLLDALSERDWTQDTRFTLHPNLEFLIEANERTKQMEITFSGKQLSLPIFVASTLALMSGRSNFTINELDSNLNESSKITLCKRLVREGFLTVCRQKSEP